MNIKYLLLLFAPLYVILADEIHLKNGQNTITTILDTVGCKIRIKRKEKEANIDKKHIDYIIFKNDTISYKDYKCNAAKKLKIVTPSKTSDQGKNKSSDHTLYLSDMTHDDPSKKDSELGPINVYIPEIWNYLTTNQWTQWRYIAEDISDSNAIFYYLEKPVAGRQSYTEPYTLALEKFTALLKENLNAKKFSEKEITKLLGSDKKKSRYLIFIQEVYEDLYETDLLTKPFKKTGFNNKVKYNDGIYKKEGVFTKDKRLKIKLTLSILDVNKKTIAYKNSHNSSRSYMKHPHTERCYSLVFNKAWLSLKKYLEK